MNIPPRSILDDLLRTGAWLFPVADQVGDFTAAGLEPSAMVVVLCAPDTARRFGATSVSDDLEADGAIHGGFFELSDAIRAMKRLGLERVVEVLARGVREGHVQVLIERTGGWVHADVAVADLPRFPGLRSSSLVPDPALPPVNARGGSA